MTSHENRLDTMNNTTQCIEALSKVEGTASISRIAYIISQLCTNLTESNGEQVNADLFNELKHNVYGDGDSTISGLAVKQLAKTFLLYIEGLMERALQESRGGSATTNRPRPPVLPPTSDDDELRPGSLTTNHSEETPPERNGTLFCQPTTSSTSAGVKSESMIAEEFTENVVNALKLVSPSMPRWSMIGGQFACSNCPRVFNSQRGVLGHSKQCFRNVDMRSSPDKTNGVVEARREDGSVIRIGQDEASPPPSNKPCSTMFDYEGRGLRTQQARVCPYCGIKLSSVHMVETHSRKFHAHERAAVYGCSTCFRWCVTVMALIKHWDKHSHCPNGQLVIRDPSVGQQEKSLAPEKEATFACSNCGKLFRSRLGVKYHVKHVCNGGRPIDLTKQSQVDAERNSNGDVPFLWPTTDA